jgi:hypothetical protein
MADCCCGNNTPKALSESNPHLHLTLTDRGFVKKHGASVFEDELERAFAIAVKGIQELPCSMDS